MSETTQPAEPTMEEILASIRRIISEDEPQSGPQAGPQSGDESESGADTGSEPEAAAESAPAEAVDVLELTRKVTEDGAIVDLEAERAAAAARAADLVAELQLEPESEPEPESESESLAASEAAPEPIPEPIPEPEPEPEPEPVPELRVAEAADPEFESDQASLLSSATQFATVDSLSQIAAAALGARTAASANLESGRSLEQIVLEAMTPVLKAWLDTHLSPLVEQVVREEIKRMVRRAEDL